MYTRADPSNLPQKTKNLGNKNPDYLKKKKKKVDWVPKKKQTRDLP